MARRTLRTSVFVSWAHRNEEARQKDCTRLGAWLCKRYVQRPLLPTHIFICLCKEVSFPPPLLEKLHGYLAAASGLVGAVYGADERKGLLLDERFKMDIINSGECQVEQVAGERGYGGEVTVEEDGVQNGLDDVLDAGGVGEDFEVVLGAPARLHAAAGSRRGRDSPRAGCVEGAVDRI